MLDKKMEAALNNQINEELFSAYIYYAMSSYYAEQNLNGLANWMTVQAKEEMVHANKIYTFVQDRGGHVELKTIDAPPSAWKTLADPFEKALGHERHITGRINELVALARELNDQASMVMLQWFVTEQVEEEKSAQEMAYKMKLAVDSPGALLLLDQEAATRTFGGETANG